MADCFRVLLFNLKTNLLADELCHVSGSTAPGDLSLGTSVVQTLAYTYLVACRTLIICNSSF